MFGEYKSKMIYKDLEVDLLYNIYKNNGLLLGLILNSGDFLMEVVFYLEKSDYLYFLVNIKIGKVYFFKILEEYNKLKEEYIMKNN